MHTPSASTSAYLTVSQFVLLLLFFYAETQAGSAVPIHRDQGEGEPDVLMEILYRTAVQGDAAVI